VRNNCQNIAEIMRTLTSKAAKRLHFLRFPELRLDALAMVDLGAQRDRGFLVLPQTSGRDQRQRHQADRGDEKAGPIENQVAVPPLQGHAQLDATAGEEGQTIELLVSK